MIRTAFATLIATASASPRMLAESHGRDLVATVPEQGALGTFVSVIGAVDLL